MAERYRDLHLQWLAGEWREGSGDESRPVVNPYSGETLVCIRSATSADVDAAYKKAAEVQVDWANTPRQNTYSLNCGKRSPLESNLPTPEYSRGVIAAAYASFLIEKELSYELHTSG